MLDYSAQLEAFRKKRICLPPSLKDTLYNHRAANRKRLISRLAGFIHRAKVGEGHFYPQGSMAIGTIVKKRYPHEEYDIDDGLVIPRSQLKNVHGVEMSHAEVREALKKALDDDRFAKPPCFCKNCVRVHYANTNDEDHHHVDIPIYRTYSTASGIEVREIASQSGWKPSDPTAVNSWFLQLVEDRNKEGNDRGTQLRHLIQFIKSFAKSREEWLDLMPSGMKLTMLVAECQPPFNTRVDLAFYELIKNLSTRLCSNKVLRNLADPLQPALTETDEDEDVVNLLVEVQEAERKLQAVQTAPADIVSIRRVWDDIFNAEGFFEEYDRVTRTEPIVETGDGDVFDVPWRENPPWPLQLTTRVVVKGYYGVAEHGSQWTEFRNNGPSLPQRVFLRFIGETNTSKPFTVYWQVVNTGKAAGAAGALRGEIMSSETAGAGGLNSTTSKAMRKERTLYTGMHWVECYIVKSGVCCARSGPFVVNIS